MKLLIPKIIVLTLAILVLPLEALASEVIRLSTKDMPGLVGVNLAKIRLFKINSSGVSETIPFQVDEKIAWGKSKKRTWALKGREGSKPGDGSWDSDEPLLFMKGDAGALNDSVEFIKADQVFKVVTDQAKSMGIYLTIGNNPPSLSPRKYVSYDPSKDVVTGETYQMGFKKGKALIQDLLKLKNGSLSYNLIDRFKLRFKISLKNLFDINFNEDEIKARILGYLSGPIRVLRLVEASKKIGLIKLIPKSQIEFLFFSDWVEVPTKINNPVEGPKFLDDDTRGLSGFDFNKAILGSDLFTNLNRAPMILDGKSEPLGPLYSGGGLRWWAFSGLTGSMVVGIKNDPKLAKLGIWPQLTLIEDLQKKSPPESYPGEIFVGFNLPYHRIPKGKYQVKVKQVIPKRFEHGREGRYLLQARIFDPEQVLKIK